ncbi:BMC domain-containing protein [Sporolactobacillus shoreicorticis]|uniref:BMC domain-containing protein n=1 Tax=Sporolactobacillus shoreicorticis TaxID=1923877 RepID=A0ABW5S555_9BACL|nr:BMC domain-containing protein [Sporolactobacillus shoreicorticis]MCO7124448.1 BMC domain-containing protein [Sporolactobacillus shoreicorticis]
MADREKIERVIEEYVPGKQITIAHLIANPNPDIYTKLGLPPESKSIGILTISPDEASIIASDIAIKSGNVAIGFLDRFSGAVVISGEVSSVEYALRQVTQTMHSVLQFDVPEITRT